MVLRHLLRPVTVPGKHFQVPFGVVVEGVGLHATSTFGPPPLRLRAEGSGLREILVVGGYAPDASRWVLEFYADAEAPGLVPMLPALYAVVQAALRFPQSAARQAGPRARRGAPALSLVDVESHRSGDSH